MKIIYTLANARSVVKAEKLCAEANIEVEVTAVPQTITSECGMAIRIDAEKAEALESLLQSQQISYTKHNA